MPSRLRRVAASEEVLMFAVPADGHPRASRHRVRLGTEEGEGEERRYRRELSCVRNARLELTPSFRQGKTAKNAKKSAFSAIPGTSGGKLRPTGTGNENKHKSIGRVYICDVCSKVRFFRAFLPYAALPKS